MRYEEPNPMTRWDSPLYAIPWDDKDMNETGEKIWNDVVLGRSKDGKIVNAVKMNAATVLVS